jgi:hypothetical protein
MSPSNLAKAAIRRSPDVAGTILDYVVDEPETDPFGRTEQLQALMVVHNDAVSLRDSQPAMRVGQKVARYPVRRW